MAESRARLEPFLLLARSTKGAAAAKVVLDATAAPGVYTFSELMDVPNIKDLSNDPTYEKQVRLLNLFAYGTLKDYTASPDAFPTLTSSHEAKLKHLTLVSHALRRRSLPYADLLSALALSSTSELETVIIDAIYAGLLAAKMHHHEQVLHVDWVTGRDLRIDDIKSVRAGLENWSKNASTLLLAIDDQIAVARRDAASRAEAEAAFGTSLDREFNSARHEMLAKKTVPKGWSVEQGDLEGSDDQMRDEVHASRLPSLFSSLAGASRSMDQRSIESLDETPRRKKRVKD